MPEPRTVRTLGVEAPGRPTFFTYVEQPPEDGQFRVDTVNFERSNAEGEVRRSFNGTYSPLYQAAYMLGGLQMRAMYAEIVDTKKMGALTGWGHFGCRFSVSRILKTRPRPR